MAQKQTKAKRIHEAGRTIVTFYCGKQVLQMIDREKENEHRRSRADMIEEILRRYFAGEVRKDADASAAGQLHGAV